MLNLPAATQAAIQAKEIWAVNLIQISPPILDPDNPPNQYFITDHYKNITIGVDTFLANGNLLQVGNIIDATGIGNQSIQLSLSGIDSTFRNEFLAASVIGANVDIDVAFLNTTTGAVIDDPLRVYSGVIWSTSSVEDNNIDAVKSVIEQSSFSVSADVRSLDTILQDNPGRFTDFNQFNRRLGLDPAQTDPAAADYPDFSMEYTADFRDKNLHFGGT